MVTIGVIGGGQLARMMIPASVNIGIDLRVFAETETSSAKLATAVVGDYGDVGQLVEFASSVDVLTFDHEHVPLEHLHTIRDHGTPVYPPPEALALTHSKILMRQHLAQLGVPQPRWAVLTSDTDEKQALDRVGGFPCIAKLPVGGYDGKGVRVIRSWDDCSDWRSAGEVLLEELVPFARELAQLSARRPQGEWNTWPLVETRQEDGVCSEVIAYSDRGVFLTSAEAAKIAEVIAHGVGVVGVLAVELFETVEGELLVNELAMRPHNSGHVFTEFSRTSQFEQHLRAVANFPLGPTDCVAEVGVMTNIFGEVAAESQSKAWESVPSAKIHAYQKAPRAGRKAGHVVVVGSDLETVLSQAREARDIVQVAG